MIDGKDVRVSQIMILHRREKEQWHRSITEMHDALKSFQELVDENYADFEESDADVDIIGYRNEWTLCMMRLSAAMQTFGCSHEDIMDMYEEISAAAGLGVDHERES